MLQFLLMAKMVDCQLWQTGKCVLIMNSTKFFMNEAEEDPMNPMKYLMCVRKYDLHVLLTIGISNLKNCEIEQSNEYKDNK